MATRTTTSLPFYSHTRTPVIEEDSTDLQGFKGRRGSFAVRVVRLGGAEPPKRHGAQAQLSQLPAPAPLNELLNTELTEKADGISGARPWQAVGARIVEALDQPQLLEKQREPGPRRGRQSHEKLEHRPNKRKGTRAGPGRKPASDRRAPQASNP